MRRLADWLLAALVLVARRMGRHRADRSRTREEEPVRSVGNAPTHGSAETVVLVLLCATTVSALAFVLVYALDRLGHKTQLLGLSLGVAFLLLAAACLVAARHLFSSEEHEESYPEPEPKKQEDVVRMVEGGAGGITRKRLLALAAGSAGGALGLALLAPAASLGPLLDWNELVRTPWRAGKRLVDEHGRPLRAADIREAAFYTAFPEGASREQLAAPLVVVRLPPSALRLPRSRRSWAPSGILAYSKICTHAGCAVSLYRTPLHAPTAPRPALVCPCHYSTFDPAAGGAVLFGPAGRPLPQLPLLVDPDGHLRAAGPFSAPVGPSWWSVRSRRPTS